MSKGRGKKDDGVTHPKKSNFDCFLDEDAVTVENNGSFYALSMDARSFKPEHIKIKITDTHVIIEGYKETEEEITECNEEIRIPEGLLPSNIECLMNTNGVLRICGPLQPKEPITKTKTVSVKTKEVKEKTTISTKEESLIDETSEQVKIVEAKQLDPSEEAKILQDKKFTDSTKDIQSKDGKLEMNIDVRGHREEDIKVSVSKRVVAIQVANTQTIDKSKEIHKRFLIPDGINPASFKSLLKKGILTVSVDDPNAGKGKPQEPLPKEPPQATPKPVEPLPIESKVVEPKEVETLERRCEDVTRQVVKINNKEKRFEAKLSVKGFKAEELRMKITKKVVIVHTETRTTTRQFNKKITLPSGVQPQGILNKLNPEDGYLTIEAPIVEEPVEETPVIETTQAPIDSKQEEVSKELRTIESDKKFEVELDVSDYKKEEVEVKVMKSVITIKGQQRIQTTQQSSSRQFFKKINVPQGIKAETIKYTINSEGKLRIYTTELKSGPVEDASKQIQEVRTGLAIIKPDIVGTGMGSTTGSLVSSGTDISKFERKVDATGYKEDEIKITIANGWITVTGKQQMGPELNFQSRQFTKKFSIPYGIKPEQITCTLEPSGILIISAGKS